MKTYVCIGSAVIKAFVESTTFAVVELATGEKDFLNGGGIDQINRVGFDFILTFEDGVQAKIITIKEV